MDPQTNLDKMRLLFAGSTALMIVIAAAGVATASDATLDKIGERYARGLSDEAHRRRVTWDLRRCAFVEDTVLSKPDAETTQTTTVPMSITSTRVKAATARTHNLEVTFTCDPQAEGCVARTRTEGGVVVGLERLSEQTFLFPASFTDGPRVSADLQRLRAGCLASTRDGGS